MSTLSYIKEDREIDKMKVSAELLSRLHGELAQYIQPGVTTQYLEERAERFIKENGAEPSFRGVGGYPFVICTSVNSQVIHGGPSDYVLKEGDLLSLDAGLCYDEYHSDAAYTYGIGKVSKKILHLLAVTEDAMMAGIDALVVGNRLGDVGNAISTVVRKEGLDLLKEYGGHGIGRKLHEQPVVSNEGRRGTGIVVQDGMTLCIEPLVVTGSPEVYEDEKTYAVVTKDGSLAAHFEHTVAVMNGKAIPLTSYKYIKEALKHG